MNCVKPLVCPLFSSILLQIYLIFKYLSESKIRDNQTYGELTQFELWSRIFD